VDGNISDSAGEEGRADVAEFEGLQGQFLFLFLSSVSLFPLGVCGSLKRKQRTQGKKQ
jgi:hypothetical protein